MSSNQYRSPSKRESEKGESSPSISELDENGEDLEILNESSSNIQQSLKALSIEKKRKKIHH
jgi:hypothetical protein